MRRLASLLPAAGVRQEQARLARERDSLALQIRDLQVAIDDVERLCAAALAERDAALQQPPIAAPPISDRVIVVDCDRPERLAAVRTSLALLTPVATALPMKRFGSIRGDGGYVLADLHGEPRRAISLGVGRESSFDRELLALGYEIHQFDHTVAPPATLSAGQHFNQLRVAGVDPGPGETTLDDIAAAIMAGQPGGPLLLKCDIEGDEWAMFEHVRPETLSQFNQIVVEFHWLHRLHEPDRNCVFKACLEKITVGHAPIHVHGNNWGRLVVNKSFAFPDVLEVTFLRRDLLGAAPAAGARFFPTPLDRPNNPDRPDYFLGPFVWRGD